jgi:hypothetical protein
MKDIPQARTQGRSGEMRDVGDEYDTAQPRSREKGKARQFQDVDMDNSGAEVPPRPNESNQAPQWHYSDVNQEYVPAYIPERRKHADKNASGSVSILFLQGMANPLFVTEYHCFSKYI